MISRVRRKKSKWRQTIAVQTPPCLMEVDTVRAEELSSAKLTIKVPQSHAWGDVVWERIIDSDEPGRGLGGDTPSTRHRDPLDLGTVHPR